MAWRAERHQAVEIEVRAPLGAVDDAVDPEGTSAASAPLSQNRSLTFVGSVR